MAIFRLVSTESSSGESGCFQFIRRLLGVMCFLKISVWTENSSVFYLPRPVSTSLICTQQLHLLKVLPHTDHLHESPEAIDNQKLTVYSRTSF